MLARSDLFVISPAQSASSRARVSPANMINDKC